jgi:probable F420-dependent oxidoreductase
LVPSVAHMKIGVHLPQSGRASGAESIHRIARRAEDLGYHAVWVSDHLISPVGQDYPTPYMLDPLTTLTWAAAVTERVRLATTVLVAPQYHPLWLANAAASLDSLSGGRLTLGLGVGWSEAEFDALDQEFANRGARTDEIIDILRIAWSEDPASYSGEYYRFADIRVLPQPAHEIPLWIGGRAEAAFRRAATRGDGFHAIGLDPTEAVAVVERIRRDRPDPSFPVSLRTGWDPLGMDPGLIKEECAAFSAAGISEIVSVPWRRDIDDYERAIEILAETVNVSAGEVHL